LIGAILANLLLTLGLSFFLGGLRYHDQRFNSSAARTYSTMMLLAAISMGVPSGFSRYFAPQGTIREEGLLNIGIAVLLLSAYGLYLFFSLGTHPGAFASVEGTGEAHHEGERWSAPRAAVALVAASLLAAWMSEALVGAAEGTGKVLGMSQTFIGIVFLAIVGGAAESGSAVAMARKNRLDLSVSVALGSSIQIALFVAPLLAAVPAPIRLQFSVTAMAALLVSIYKVSDSAVIQPESLRPSDRPMTSTIR